MRHFTKTCLRTTFTALLPALLVTMFTAAPAFGQGGVARISATEKQLFDRVNQEREKANAGKAINDPTRLKPYVLNAKLCTASRKYCKFMANANQIGHQVDGRTPSQRVKAEGYPRFVLENFGGGQSSPEQMVRDWMASKAGHRTTILSAKDTEVGVGNARSADGTNVWILVAGRSAEANNPPKVAVAGASPSKQPAAGTQQDPKGTNPKAPVPRQKPQPLKVDPKPQPKAPKQQTLAVSRTEKELFDEINARRTATGLTALKPNTKLFSAARRHAKHMARVEQLNHVLDGKSPTDRGLALGYNADMDEVFNGGAVTAARAVRDWMGGQRLAAKLLNPNTTELGIGLAQSRDGTNVWNITLGASSEANNPPRLKVQ